MSSDACGTGSTPAPALCRRPPSGVFYFINGDAAEPAQPLHRPAEILDLSGRAISRFEGRRDEGRYLLPAPSGKRTLRITADGYEAYEEALDLDPAELSLAKTVQLRPK